MSTKKPIIDKSRFAGLKKISEKPQETAKSRFDEDEKVLSVVELDLDDLYDAPSEWNFYKPLPEDKFIELLESIVKNGLLHPIVVWEQDKGYMVLAGHNRLRAFKALRDNTETDQYSKIPAIIKTKNQINENTAQEIIIDTNWVARQLSSSEKTDSILKKYVYLKKDATTKGKLRDIIGQSLGITGRMVQNYLSLKNLKPEYFDMIDDNVIGLNQAITLSRLDKNLQDYIYDMSTRQELNFDFLKKIKNNTSIQELKNIIKKSQSEVEEMISITVKIPKNAKKDFLKIYREYMENFK